MGEPWLELLADRVRCATIGLDHSKSRLDDDDFFVNQSVHSWGTVEWTLPLSEYQNSLSYGRS